MKLAQTLLILSSIVIYGCSKDNDETPQPEEPGTQLVKAVFRQIYINNELLVDTVDFTYDDQGRVTSRYNRRTDFREDFRYTGDKVSFVGSIVGTEMKNNLKEAVYSSNGDTIMLDFSQPNNSGGTDTVQLTYIYDEGMATHYQVYLTFASGSKHFETTRYKYNDSKNLTEVTLENRPFPETNRITVTAWDDKVNPMHGQPKLNFLFLQAGNPARSTGLHNPIRFTDYDGEHEVEMTYNSKGYPLTFKLKDADYVQAEFFYE